MGRLKSIGPALTTLRPVLGRLTDAEGHSPVTEPWRAWYHSVRWRKKRIEIFKRDHFTCRMCGRVNGNTSHLTCDHVEPHRGDEGLFWSDGNLQTLCTDPCHNAHKQALERRARGW